MYLWFAIESFSRDLSNGIIMVYSSQIPYSGYISRVVVFTDKTCTVNICTHELLAHVAKRLLFCENLSNNYSFEINDIPKL